MHAYQNSYFLALIKKCNGSSDDTCYGFDFDTIVIIVIIVIIKLFKMPTKHKQNLQVSCEKQEVPPLASMD